MQLARLEHCQEHLLLEVLAARRDARRLAHHRASAVAAHDVVGFERAALSARAEGRTLSRGEPAPRVAVALSARLGDLDARAVLVLLDALHVPAEERRDVRESGEFRAQDGLRAVLRQAFVLLVVERLHRLASGRRVPVVAHQVLVRRDAADGVVVRHDAGRTQFVHDAPEVEVLQRALAEVLSLGDALRLRVPFHDRARDAPHPKLDAERRTHRPSASDDHLVALSHASLSRRRVGVPRRQSTTRPHLS